VNQCGGVHFLGRVAKGVKCSVTGCSNDAVRSLQTDKVKNAGLKVSEARKTYLCKEHYKEFKKETKKDRTWKNGDTEHQAQAERS
jgi:hypothetical protein